MFVLVMHSVLVCRVVLRAVVSGFVLCWCGVGNVLSIAL